jgi:hypothetical protein
MSWLRWRVIARSFFEPLMNASCEDDHERDEQVRDDWAHAARREAQRLTRDLVLGRSAIPQAGRGLAAWR